MLKGVDGGQVSARGRSWRGWTTQTLYCLAISRASLDLNVTGIKVPEHWKEKWQRANEESNQQCAELVMNERDIFNAAGYWTKFITSLQMIVLEFMCTFSIVVLHSLSFFPSLVDILQSAWLTPSFWTTPRKQLRFNDLNMTLILE